MRSFVLRTTTKEQCAHNCKLWKRRNRVIEAVACYPIVQKSSRINHAIKNASNGFCCPDVLFFNIMIDGRSISLENFYSAFPFLKKSWSFESWNSCLDWIWQICCSCFGNSQKKMSTEAGGGSQASLHGYLPPWTIIMRNSTLTFIRLLLVIARRKWLLVFSSPKVVLLQLHDITESQFRSYRQLPKNCVI